MRIKLFTCPLMRMDPHMRTIRMNRMDLEPHGPYGHPTSLAPLICDTVGPIQIFM